MADLTSGNRAPVDQMAGNLKRRKLQLQVKVMETDIERREVEILELQDQVMRKRSEISGLEEKIAETKAILEEQGG